jgi:hypothetical protein
MREGVARLARERGNAPLADQNGRSAQIADRSIDLLSHFGSHF